MSCEAVVKRFTKKIAEDFQRTPSATECTSLRLTKCTNDENDPMYSSGDIFGMRLVRKTAGRFLPQSAQVDIGTHNRVKWLDREEAASWYRAVDKEDEFGLPRDDSSTWRM